MENRLDILTRKLYDEGVDKANREAERLINRARQEAVELLAAAETEVAMMKAEADREIESLKKRADSEIAISVRQSIAALKQSITGLVAGRIAGDIARAGFEDKTFVQELLVSIVKKWDITSGKLDLELLLSAEEKADFEKFVAEKHKELLDKGLEIKVRECNEGFVIQPKGDGYQIIFSETLFEVFFGQYIRNFTKALLYK